MQIRRAPSTPTDSSTTSRTSTSMTDEGGMLPSSCTRMSGASWETRAAVCPWATARRNSRRASSRSRHSPTSTLSPTWTSRPATAEPDGRGSRILDGIGIDSAFTYTWTSDSSTTVSTTAPEMCVPTNAGGACRGLMGTRPKQSIVEEEERKLRS